MGRSLAVERFVACIRRREAAQRSRRQNCSTTVLCRNGSAGAGHAPGEAGAEQADRR